MKKSIIARVLSPLALFALVAFVFIHIPSVHAQTPIDSFPTSVVPTPIVCYTFTSNLGIGSTGADVVALQTWLIAQGFNLPSITAGFTPKGYFGVETQFAVKKYQLSRGIEQTGLVGPLTRASLNSACENGGEATSPTFELVSTSIESGGSDIASPYLLARFKIKITAFSDDTLVSSTSLATLGLYRAGVVVNPGRYSSVSIMNLTSTDLTPDGYYEIEEGVTEQFEIAYSYVAPSSVVVAGSYRVALESLAWKNQQGITSTYAGKDDWKTNYAVMNGTGVNTPTLTPAVTLRSPNGGETVALGETLNVLWNSDAPLQSVDIKILDSSGQVLTKPSQEYVTPYDANGQSIGFATMINGEPVLPVGRYKARVCSSGTNRCDDSDRTFSVIESVSNVSPNISRVSPQPVSIGSTLTVYASNAGRKGNVIFKNADGSKTWSTGYSNDITNLNGFAQYDGNKLSFTIPSTIGLGVHPDGWWNEPTVAVTDGTYEVYLTSLDARNNFIKSNVMKVSVGRSNTSSGSVSATLVDASSDKVSSGFGPGVGIGNKNPSDWHWVATLSNSTSKVIKEIDIKHNIYGERWSTTDDHYYPVAVFQDGRSLNSSYKKKMTIDSGTVVLDLYGQAETNPFYGGTITVTYDDGSVVTGTIPSSSIRQGGYETGKPYITSVAGKAAGNFEIDASGTVGIQGTNLAGYRDSTNVYIGGMVCTITQLSNTLIYCTAPSNLNVGSTYDLYINTVGSGGDKVTSNTVRVKVLSQLSTNNRAPIISGITAPTILKVNETGTWSIVASDPENSSLSYSVDWGESICPAGYICSASSGASFSQTSSFTHSYARAGTYTVKVTVTDAAGLKAQTSSTVRVDSIVTSSTITVMSPNGGEVLKVGDYHTIKWTSTGATQNNVRIGIVGPNNGGGDIAVVANTGSYSWRVPPSIGNIVFSATTVPIYKIGVSSEEAVAGFAADFSNAAFAITTQMPTPSCPVGYICTPAGQPTACPAGSTCAPTTLSCPSGYTCYTKTLTTPTVTATTPYITIVSPRYENLKIGVKHQIKWKDSREKGKGLSPAYVITLSGSNGKQVIADNLATGKWCDDIQCYYDWTPTVSSTNNQISIYDTANDPNGVLVGRSTIFNIEAGSPVSQTSTNLNASIWQAVKDYMAGVR